MALIELRFHGTFKQELGNGEGRIILEGILMQMWISTKAGVADSDFCTGFNIFRWQRCTVKVSLIF